MGWLCYGGESWLAGAAKGDKPLPSARPGLTVHHAQFTPIPRETDAHFPAADSPSEIYTAALPRLCLGSETKERRAGLKAEREAAVESTDLSITRSLARSPATSHFLSGRFLKKTKPSGFLIRSALG